MSLRVGKQHGAALMVALVLLVVALILGLSSFQSSRMDESMAGNQRASSLAMMTAEYGASNFWYAVNSAEGMGGPGAPDAGDDYDAYMLKILGALEAWAQSGGVTGVQECAVPSHNGNDPVPNSCFVISIGSVDGNLLSIVSDGIVFSGDTAGISFDGYKLEDLPDNWVARRQVRMQWGVVLGESLSAINLVGNVANYSGINSQAEISGEEVDGYVNPAISVPTYEDAEKIVKDILKNKLDGKAIFVPEDPSEPKGNGVWHATDVVNEAGEYTGDYSSCTTANNNLCNYKGGIAAQLGSPILTKPEDYHAFIESLLTQQAEVGGENRATYWTPNIAQDFDAGVHFVTGRVSEGQFYDGGLDYEPVVYNPENLNDDGTLSRSSFKVGNGDFSGSGVLVVDGNVEFAGNPDFDGLIIVLGDYTIKGSGGEPFTGAIISSPYSEHYRLDGQTIVPRFDGEVFLGFYLPGGTDPITTGTGDDERLLTFDDVGGEGPISRDKQFDLVNVDVSGGGSQDYSYSYQSLLEAFAFFNGETLLALLVGQAKPDGTYDYGLSTWQEVVVP